MTPGSEVGPGRASAVLRVGVDGLVRQGRELGLAYRQIATVLAQAALDLDPVSADSGDLAHAAGRRFSGQLRVAARRVIDAFLAAADTDPREPGSPESALASHSREIP